MKIFLNAYEHKVLDAIFNGYTMPYKPRSEWSATEAEAHKYNFRALNAIDNGLAPDEFRRIDHLKTTKET